MLRLLFMATPRSMLFLSDRQDGWGGHQLLTCSGCQLRKIPCEKNWQPATLNSCPSAFPDLPFASPKHITETSKFFPTVLLSTDPPCRAQSAPTYGHYLGIPAPRSLVFLITCSRFFEGTVQNFTEMGYLQERGLIWCCSSSHKDIRHRSLQLLDRMRPRSCLSRW